MLTVTFCCGSDLLLSAGTDGRVKIWDIAASKELTFLSCSHPTVTQLVVSSSKIFILACEDLRFLSLWALRSRAQLFSIEAHKEEIVAMDIDEKEQFAMSAGKDGYIRLWDIPTGKCITTIGYINPIRFAKVTSQNYVLYCGESLSFCYYPLHVLKSGQLAIKALEDKLFPTEYEEPVAAAKELAEEKVQLAIRKAAAIMAGFRSSPKPDYDGFSAAIKELMQYEDRPSLNMLNLFGTHNEIVSVYFASQLSIASCKPFYAFPLCFTDDRTTITAVSMPKDRDKLVYGTNFGSICIFNVPTCQYEMIKDSDIHHKTGEISVVCFIQSGKIAACSHKHIFLIIDIKSSCFLCIKNVLPYAYTHV